MTAALHLAQAHEPPPGPKRKRKGGGGNGKNFYEIAERIYGDERADHHARELLLAVAFAVCTETTAGKAQWALVSQCLGPGPRRRSLAELARHDLPRYVLPEHQPGGYDPSRRRCQGPRIRPYKERINTAGWNQQQKAEQAQRDREDFRNVQNICGDPGQISVLEKQLGTGWHVLHYFCNRHRAEADRVRQQVREQNEIAPAPVPNAGGLLPSYFDADWLKFYRHYTRADWEPPVYGIRADDWPVPGKEPVAPRARLRLAALDGDVIP